LAVRRGRRTRVPACACARPACPRPTARQPLGLTPRRAASALRLDSPIG
jgi:hypothetical protein